MNKWTDPDRYSFDLRKSTAPSRHIWATSLYSATAPLPGTVAGVKGCYSPPFAAGELQLQLQFSVDGREIEDTGSLRKEDCGLLFAGAVWHPDRITRRGTYHWRKDDGLYSIGVTSELVPLTGRAGFILTTRIVNRCGRSIELSIAPLLDPGLIRYVPLSKWKFSPPTGGDRASSRSSNVWETGEMRITLLHDELVAELAQGEDAEFRIAIVLTEAGCTVEMPVSLSAWEEETAARWDNLIANAELTMPRIETDIPGLAAYYQRSLVSGLVCLWDHPSFKIRPLPATSGIDGGGINSYPWDAAGYVGQMLTMLIGSDKSVDYLQFMVDGGIDRHICFAPDGSGDRPYAYSYNLWAFFQFAWSIFCQHGVLKELYPLLVWVLEVDDERLTYHGELLDYGNQRQLLEMRSSGYEHIVASPNAERAWCYERLADLAEYCGHEEAGRWREKAERIRQAIEKELWDQEAGWFQSLYPDGHRERIYSIQAFDALRMGVCTPEMERALLLHLREGAFLGEYGVSSVSVEDELHYELNDPDWSGGGSFTGEGPILAQTLWEIGQPELAWDVMKRHFWMGKHLPYFPQEHYCDRPQAPAHKRANNISGMAGAQAIIFGMAGIRPQLDGSLLVNPQPPAEGRVSILGYMYRGHCLDVYMEPGHCRIVCDGKEVHNGIPSLQKVIGSDLLSNSAITAEP